jgi:hypothetical protein
MLYRPKYCCNCGEKIERDEWRLWTSRRFCALCETEYKPYDLLPRAVVICGLAVALFGIGSYLRAPESERRISAATSRSTQKLKPSTNVTLTGNSSSTTSTQSPDVGADDAEKQINEQPQTEKRTSDEVVFYCGAITKKGSPCTRRVKRKGFCWQHAKASQIAPARF